MKIVADIHERRSGVPQLLAARGLAVDMRSLWAGDYEVGERAIVERKTVLDLHASIVKGTFWTQIGRLRQAARFSYVLIEGPDLDAGPLSPAVVRGICVALMDLGVGVVRSTGASDSASWLHRLAVRRTEVRYRNAPAYAQRPKRRAGFPAAEAALACVPGVSRVSAQALLAHFGSLAAIARADATDLREVPGIGPERASALTATFHTRYTASRARPSRERQDLST